MKHLLALLPAIVMASLPAPAQDAAPPPSTSASTLGRFRSVLPRLALSPEQRAELMKALEAQHAQYAQYDAQAKMLRKPVCSPGYHTTLKGGLVHPTRDSANYAAALLDTGDAEMERRAIEVLGKVLELQDTDPDSKTHGIWPWFLEEPLGQMAPPDWNWADFIGTQLLQIAISHRGRLPAEMQARLDRAIVHAARSIQKRNVGPGYTNIAIMGTYVTLVASDIYAIPDLNEYALKRLRAFSEFTRQNGGFNEYNSPTYTTVAIEELARLRMHAREPEAKSLADDLYRVAWEEVAHHWHAPTGQWAGPHSRSYRTLLGADHARLIERSLRGELNPRLPLPIPDGLHPYFTSLEAPRTLAKTFTQARPQRGEAALVGTTYLHPKFALGSINWGEMWNQRRPLVAYWGTREKPSYLALRFLRDGYDFSSAQFFSAQKEGRVLAGLVLATDAGNTHISLDRLKNATVTAKDLRLRFEIGGAAASSTWEAPADLNAPATLRLDGLSIRAAVPFARLGEEAGRWEMGRDKDRAFLDLVLYAGEEKSFQISALQAAAISVALQISTEGEEFQAPQAAQADGMLSTSWGGLCLAIPSRPAKVGELRVGASWECR